MGSKVIVCGLDTSTLPKLNHEQSLALLSRIESGDENAREQFIIANMRLVLSMIKRFYKSNANSDDLFQAGMIGLIKAVDNFDLAFNVKFSTYAVTMILGEIKRLLRGANSLKVARSIRDTAFMALKTRGELEKTGKDISLNEVASTMNVPIKDVAFALDAISDTVSIYEPVYSKNGDELLIMDSLGDDKNTDELWTENIALKSALKTLDEREKQILYLRYYEGKTQTEISDEIGISQAQISRIEKNALSFMKSKITV